MNIRFYLTGFHSPLMDKGFTVIAESPNNPCKVVVELSPNLKVGDDLFVLNVSILQFLQRLLPVLGRRIPFVCSGKLSVSFTYLYSDLVLIMLVLSHHVSI